MKNYISTAKGFIKSVSFNEENQGFEIHYTDKVRYAQTFKTGGATTFMEKHGIEGFVWKPYEEEAIRNMYVVKRHKYYGFEEHKKAVMINESDVKFLMCKKLVKQDLLTFEAAKAKALRLNLELLDELNTKISELTEQIEK